MSSIKGLAFLALATGLASVSNAQATSGSGTTTRYWDCCKGSCSWPDKASVSSPVTTCDKNDSPLTDFNTASACTGGEAYMCSNQSPWAVSDDLAYGFAAVSAGGSEADTCCSCYQLTFTSTSIAGKKMIVQATNTGSDVGEGQFDLAIPGGGVGIYNACTAEWGAPASGWGAQYGGISTDTCSTLPTALQPGCEFRFGDWFEGADNPTVDWEKVTCPKALTDITGCVRSGETPTSGSSSASASSQATSAASSSVASSSAASSSVVAASAAYTSETSAAAAASSVVASSSAASSPAVESSVVYSAESSATASSPAAYTEAASSAASSTVAESSVAYSAQTSAAASSSAAAPVESSVQSSSTDAYVASSATGVTAVPSAQSSAAAPLGAPEDGEECEVQYVYE